MEERRKMLILLEDRLVKEALCVEIMQRCEKRDGTSFYNYESKEHFICKVQSSGAAMVSAPRAQPCQLHILLDLEDREWVYTSAFLKMRSLAMTSKSRKICFLLMCRLGEFSLQIFCGFIKLNQKESLNRSIALGNCIKSQLASLAPWGIANLPSSPLGRLTLFAFLTEGGPRNVLFPEALGVVQPRGTSSPPRWTTVHVLSHQTQRVQLKSFYTRQGQNKIFGFWTSAPQGWFTRSCMDSLCLVVKLCEEGVVFFGFKLWRRNPTGHIGLKLPASSLQGKMKKHRLNTTLFPLF